MLLADKERLDCFMIGLKRRNSGQPEFHQAVYEVVLDTIPFFRVADAMVSCGNI